MNSHEILAMADERFERRLTEESAAIRQEMTAIRTEMATHAEMQAIRQDLAALRGLVVTREEIGALQQTVATRREINNLTQEMSAGFTRLHQELANTRVEMIKWSFVFWTGQCLAILGFLFVFLRNS